MNIIEAEAAKAAGWFENRLHGHRPPTVMIKTTPGEHMPLASDLRDLAGKIEPLGDEALAQLQAVTAHPEAPAVLADLARLAGLNLPQGTLTAAASGLKAVLGMVYGTQPAQPQQGEQPSFTPSGPQVAGQAH